MTYRGLMADICWELCQTQLPESSASPRIEHHCLGTHPEGDDHYGDCSGPRTRSRRHLSIFRHITQPSNRCQIMTSPPSSLRVLPRRSRSRSPSLTPTIHPSQPLSTASAPIQPPSCPSQPRYAKNPSPYLTVPSPAKQPDHASSAPHPHQPSISTPTTAPPPLTTPWE